VLSPLGAPLGLVVGKAANYVTGLSGSQQELANLLSQLDQTTSEAKQLDSSLIQAENQMKEIEKELVEKLKIAESRTKIAEARAKNKLCYRNKVLVLAVVLNLAAIILSFIYRLDKIIPWTEVLAILWNMKLLLLTWFFSFGTWIWVLILTIDLD